MKFIIALLAVAIVACVVNAGVQDGAFVHLFEWSWPDVAQECEDFLGPMGYQAVQVSPPMEHIKGDAWWTRYQPVSYILTSRSGDEDQFKDMVNRCNKAGVAIIADAVVNHMASTPSGTAQGVAGTDFYGRQFAPYNYDASLMHHTQGNDATNCAVTNYNSAENVQQCDLVGLVDLDYESGDVQGIVASYINKLTGMGVKGVRIDAAKHIKPESLGAMFNKLSGNPYRFQEVIYGAGEPVTPEQYVSMGQVTEFRFGTNLFSNFKQGAQDTMQYFNNFGAQWGMINSEDAVTFTDNHDTQRSASNVMTYKMGQNYNLANYFMLAHPYGHPKVMSSYYFSDNDAGPPGSAVHSGSNVDCGNGNTWVCEHRRGGIANMAHFRMATAGTNVTDWQQDKDNANRIAFGRAGKGFFAINMDQGQAWQDVTFETGMADGKYCNAIVEDNFFFHESKAPKTHGLFGSGGCADNQETVEVQNGQAKVSVPSMGALAIHIGAKA